MMHIKKSNSVESIHVVFNEMNPICFRKSCEIVM
ncbi:hypothetical protein SLEP1_g24861 [Rubroshorea leprosula]|uniref:Uncharacterized protein n=1 Tax=Rubroshorea leprosula TaxID=152421 RepID=A0AAV5JK42_9ROSI|nr:hypothetical protein SLEP1_g24861 [Rubroshorea leprosula]